jgi:hypothetical protein
MHSRICLFLCMYVCMYVCVYACMRVLCVAENGKQKKTD